MGYLGGVAKGVLFKFVSLVCLDPIKTPGMRSVGLHFILLDPKIVVTDSF